MGNKYFKSIGRTDRYINQLDNPQIITNFIEWHNVDKEKNKFDGELLETGEKLHMINNVISKIGDVRLGPATKIYTKLKKDVVIEKTTWMELPQFGVLDEIVAANAAKNKQSALELVDDWQNKLIEYFRENEMDGKKVVEGQVKQTCQALMDHLDKGNKKLRGGVNQVLRALKKCYVHEILEKAKAAQAK